ncbi:DUF4192 family protein [Nesterenkonia sp. PF2B19]|uniref:DUF4192 family protein n=1 Tax=Nesterenkonia sp. PF2B19 TaxID=1881858 RepID=UPI0009F2BE4E|nr:DUF4192 family protein [Nesterenkonia sp. PF2B19]OSM44794.1 hypothetical protein BCY76_000290 [Nesterenkonia sp. PF2B19]
MSTPRIPQDDHTPSDTHPLPTDGAEQQVITVSGPEDAVALVHHTLGFLPEDSLVVMGLHAGRTGAHLRIDLSAGVDHPDRLAHWVGRHLLGSEVTPAPDGAVIFLFTDEEPAPPTWRIRLCAPGPRCMPPSARLCARTTVSRSSRRGGSAAAGSGTMTASTRGAVPSPESVSSGRRAASSQPTWPCAAGCRVSPRSSSRTSWSLERLPRETTWPRSTSRRWT